MARVITINCIIFLLGQIFFLNSSSAYLNELTTTIVDKNGLNIKLNWIKTDEFLANKNLPVWRATSRTHLTRDEEVMNKIGYFETYHDLDKSSAVVYIEKEKCLFGVIDMRYLIIGLPVEKLQENHVVGKSKYVIEIENDSIVLLDLKHNIDHDAIDLDVPSSSNVNSKLSSIKRPHVDTKEYLRNSDVASISCDFSHLPFKKRPRYDVKDTVYNYNEPSSSYASAESHKISDDNENSDSKSDGQFYPEIFLIVSHNTMKMKQHFQSYDDYLKDHILYYIIYMNAVAMLFAKLKKDVKININIAGVVFEEVENAFPFSTSQFKNGQLICPTQELVSHSIKRYLNELITFNHGQPLNTEDAFDFFLFSTTFNYALNKDNGIHRGLSTEWFDIYKWRSYMKKLKVDNKFLGSIVHNGNILQTYVDTTREIAHLMKVNDDTLESHTIMQQDGSYQCPDCLKWSSNSVQSFKDFFSRNKNRCFLLNEPRSLYEYDVPRETLSPGGQCKCYDLISKPEDAKYLSLVNQAHTCHKRLPCLRAKPKILTFSEKLDKKSLLRTIRSTPYPLDGTPCDYNKVCWNKKCVPGVMKIGTSV